MLFTGADGRKGDENDNDWACEGVNSILVASREGESAITFQAQATMRTSLVASLALLTGYATAFVDTRPYLSFSSHSQRENCANKGYLLVALPSLHAQDIKSLPLTLAALDRAQGTIIHKDYLPTLIPTQYDDSITQFVTECEPTLVSSFSKAQTENEMMIKVIDRLSHSTVHDRLSTLASIGESSHIRNHEPI